VRLAPVVEQIAREYAGKVKVLGLDAHNNLDTASKFDVMGLPTLLFFKDGKEVGRLIGAVPRDRIVGEIQSKLGA
jgi:thiol-disulfide isomerase/thioredoxin